MNPIFDFFLAPYRSYSTAAILIEAVAVFTGLLSVWYAKQNKIGVYPTGMISTSIYVYLLFQWMLLGDMLINMYYFSMSVYGWYYWTRKDEQQAVPPITIATPKEWRVVVAIIAGSLLFVYGVYRFVDRWDTATAYIDTITTAIFFAGMWLMARRKMENWIFWIIAAVIYIPLYFYKGFPLPSLQYLLFTGIAILGYRSWKRHINSSPLAAEE